MLTFTLNIRQLYYESKVAGNRGMTLHIVFPQSSATFERYKIKMLADGERVNLKNKTK